MQCLRCRIVAIKKKKSRYDRCAISTVDTKDDRLQYDPTAATGPRDDRGKGSGAFANIGDDQCSPNTSSQQ